MFPKVCLGLVMAAVSTDDLEQYWECNEYEGECELLDAERGAESDSGSVIPSEELTKTQVKRLEALRLTASKALKIFNNCRVRTEAAMAKVLAATPSPRIKAKVTRWVWDTGAGVDVVNGSAIENMQHLVAKSQNRLSLCTADGESAADEEVLLKITALKEVTKPYVLDGSPALLSVGWRCMELGYDFWWPAFRAPIVTTPSGATLTLEVDEYVPYLKSTAYSCSASSKATIFGSLPLLPSYPTRINA